MSADPAYGGGGRSTCGPSSSGGPDRRCGHHDAQGRLTSGFWYFSSECFKGDRVRLGSATTACVQGVNRGHLVVRQLEVEGIDVSAMRLGLVDFGMTERPCCRPQRNIV